MASNANVISPDLPRNLNYSSDEQLISSQMDLFKKSRSDPVYKYRVQSQVAGGNSLTLSTNQTQSIFNIPGSQIFNFAKSFLLFDVTFPVAGDGVTKDNVLATNYIPMQSITLRTSSGTILAQIQNAFAHTRVAPFLAIDLDEYESRGPVYVASTVANAYNSTNQFCQPYKGALGNQVTSNQIGPNMGNTANPGSNVASYQMSVNNTGGAIVNEFFEETYTSTFTWGGGAVYDETEAKASTVATVNTLQARPVSYSGQNNFNTLAPQMWAYGGGKATAGNTVTRCKVNLKSFVGTLMAMDKDLWFSDNLQLEIYWCPLSQWGFNSVNDLSSKTNFASGSFSNYNLWLAEDVNNENKLAIKDQMLNGGFQLFVPYVNSFQNTVTVPAGGSANYQISNQISAGTGICLKRVVTTVQEDYTTYNGILDNVGGCSYTDVRSYLANVPIQDLALNVAASQDYHYLFELIKNSPACLDNRNFNINSFFLDNFSDCQDSTKFPENDIIDSGLRIDNSQTYTIQYSLASTAGDRVVNIFQFHTWLRRLEINNMGIRFVS